jgi:hypothetical protein
VLAIDHGQAGHRLLADLELLVQGSLLHTHRGCEGKIGIKCGQERMQCCGSGPAKIRNFVQDPDP